MSPLRGRARDGKPLPRCGPVARVTVRGSAVELTSLGELFILVLPPFVAWLWPGLDSYNWWFVFAHVVLNVGEMLLSQIGHSAVPELSLPRVVGFMMGGRSLGTAYSEVLLAQLGKLSAIGSPEGEVSNIADALAKYDALIVLSAQIGIVSGVVAQVLRPRIRRWVHGVR